MVNFNRVIIDKNFIKESLGEKEHIAKSLSRFIDNSIIARSKVTTCDNPCRVHIWIFNDLITISDNSGGINNNLTEKELFRIGTDNGGYISGIGIKKSFFSLGNKMDIISNNKDYSRKFSLDINIENDELESKSDVIEYNSEMAQGTIIYISELNKAVNREITNIDFILEDILLRLGRMYSKFIAKCELDIKVNGELVVENNILGKKVGSCKILDNYEVDLYKGNKATLSGVDLYINDFMILDREKNKYEVKWKMLNEAKHRYTDCIVEIRYHGDKLKHIEEKDELFTQVIEFIKQNKVYFESQTITIQYEMPIDKVEELKEYYGEDTAKAIGIIAFNRCYSNYLDNKKKYNIKS